MLEGRLPQTAETVPERRTGHRHMAVLLLVKLTLDGREALARISNLSRTGARLETSLPLAVGDTLGIELRSDVAAGATVRWVDGQSAGIEFAAPIDVDRFLSRKISMLSRTKPRAPRYVCDAPAVVITENEPVTAHLLDLSLSGARLSGHHGLRPDDVVVVQIEGLRPRRARIAWTRGREAGIEFMLPLNYRELDKWLSESQHRVQAAAER